MQVFIAGATGVLGRRLVSQFTDRGHPVVGLTRDEDGDESVVTRGGKPRRGDLFDEESVISASEGADVVIHAATAIPTDDPSPEDWEINTRVRREGTQALVKAAANAGADQYLQQSIAWVARKPDGSWFDEESPIQPDPSTQSAIDAEAITHEAMTDHDFDIGILRCGYFYAPDAYHTRVHGQALLEGEQTIIEGSKSARISRIHVHDAASAFVAVAEAGRSGLWHIVDDEPVSAADFSKELGKLLGAPDPEQISEEEARRDIGDRQVDLYTRPMPTTNAKIRSEIGWEPEYPTYRDGLEQVVETWRGEGTLAEAE
ncbi:epimerase (plasmid) [Salinigranum rubrum]|uniref:Epimerase n=1 Tax=Salinigranum rubrum TaxID=755307 RepID=A0A2I8VQ92_9EURY|nr:NAD(P)-dependent oxidoreductase [Salinigranum rubrum]AUV84093.1 epimerase [Salinigranum rubrum]